MIFTSNKYSTVPHGLGFIYEISDVHLDYKCSFYFGILFYMNILMPRSCRMHVVVVLMFVINYLPSFPPPSSIILSSASYSLAPHLPFYTRFLATFVYTSRTPETRYVSICIQHIHTYNRNDGEEGMGF